MLYVDGTLTGICCQNESGTQVQTLADPLLGSYYVTRVQKILDRELTLLRSKEFFKLVCRWNIKTNP